MTTTDKTTNPQSKMDTTRNSNSNNDNNGKFPVMMPTTTTAATATRNIPTPSIIPSMMIDATTNTSMRINMNPLQHNYHHHHHHHHQQQHPTSYLINQSSNSGVSYNRNDNHYHPIDQSKNSMNRSQHFRSNLLSGMPHQGFSTYGFYNNKRKRRERTSFTKTQLNVLLETYAVQPYPDVQQRLDIAARIGLDESRVQVWFKNRRAKERKDELVANSIRANNNNQSHLSSSSQHHNVNNTTTNNNNNNNNHHHHQQQSIQQQQQQQQHQSNQSSNPQDHHTSQQQSNTHHDQYISNTTNNRYPTNIHLPNPTPFVELFGVSAFADENDVINQYADLLPNSQQDSNVNAFSMNPSAIGITKEEAELLISSSPNLPKLQPLKQNFNDTPSKQH